MKGCASKPGKLSTSPASYMVKGENLLRHTEFHLMCNSTNTRKWIKRKAMQTICKLKYIHFDWAKVIPNTSHKYFYLIKKWRLWNIGKDIDKHCKHVSYFCRSHPILSEKQPNKISLAMWFHFTCKDYFVGSSYWHALAREAGRMTTDLHIFLHSPKSNSSVSSPALQQSCYGLYLLSLSIPRGLSRFW